MRTLQDAEVTWFSFLKFVVEGGLGYGLLQASGSVCTESVQFFDGAVELSLDGASGFELFVELVESGVELPSVLFGGAGVDDDFSGEYTVFAGVFTGDGFAGVGRWAGRLSGVSTVGCDAVG